MATEVKLQIWNTHIKNIPPIAYAFDTSDDADTVSRIDYVLQRGKVHARNDGRVGLWITHNGKFRGLASVTGNPESADHALADRLPELGLDPSAIRHPGADVAHEIDEVIDKAMALAIKRSNNRGVDVDPISSVTRSQL